MFDYTIKENEFMSELYNLILDLNTFEIERKIYSQAKNLIEIDKEYYTAVARIIIPKLIAISQKNQLSTRGTKFLLKIIYL